MVKVSGWYRLQATAPYSPLDGHLQRVAGLFAERLVWGSDWPHPFDPQALPSYSSTLEPVTRDVFTSAKN